MPQVAPFFVSKSQVVPFFIVTWPPNLISSDMFKGISGPDPDSKLAPNIIDKYKLPKAQCTTTDSSITVTHPLIKNTNANLYILIRHKSRCMRVSGVCEQKVPTL
jgi:hypothetical protein